MISSFILMAMADNLRIQRRWTISRGLMWVGIAITLIFVLLALLAPAMQSWGWLQDPQKTLQNVIHDPPPTWGQIWQWADITWNNRVNPVYGPPQQIKMHWFGTSVQGYDIFSRTLFGARAAWQVVLLATAMSVVVGVPLGMVSGYLGGKLDRGLLFFMDAIYTLPVLLLAVTLAFILGKGVINAAAALSIAYIPQYYRVVRNHTVSLKTELFVEAAQAMGASTWAVLSRYLFLNVVQSVPVLFTLNTADAVLILGGLGFLGLGLPDEVPEWGSSLRQALGALPTGIWWTALFPGLAITGMVTGLSLIGEGLNDLVNPLVRKEN